MQSKDRRLWRRDFNIIIIIIIIIQQMPTRQLLTSAIQTQHTRGLQPYQSKPDLRMKRHWQDDRSVLWTCL